MQKEIPVITGHGYMDNTGTYHNFYEENTYSITKDLEAGAVFKIALEGWGDEFIRENDIV